MYAADKPFNGVCVAQSWRLRLVFNDLLLFLVFFDWPLHSMYFCYVRSLITPSISSTSPFYIKLNWNYKLKSNKNSINDKYQELQFLIDLIQCCKEEVWRFKIWFNPPFLYQVRVITVFTVFRLLTDFVCLYTYEFWLSLCKIVRSSVILLLPLFKLCFFYYTLMKSKLKRW